jgi:hypothetical protein
MDTWKDPSSQMDTMFHNSIDLKTQLNIVSSSPSLWNNNEDNKGKNVHNHTWCFLITNILMKKEQEALLYIMGRGHRQQYNPRIKQTKKNRPKWNAYH